MVGAIAWWTWQERQRERQFDVLIRAVTQAYDNIDPLLVRAVIWRETNFDPTELGRAQERGLMQVTPLAGKEWAVAMKKNDFTPEQLTDPRIGIEAGVWYLSRALKRWSHTENPIPFALAEYNAGRSNALRWVHPHMPENAEAFRERIDFPTTKRYILLIEEKYREYQEDSVWTIWKSLWQRIERRLSL